MSQPSSREFRRLLNHLFDYDYLAKQTWVVDLVRPWLATGGTPTGLDIHDALVQAMEEVRTGGHALGMDKDQRAYLILHDTYVQKLPLAQILKRIGISRAAYFREKNRALAHLEAVLRHRSREMHLALKESEFIPRLQGFVGRQADLAYFRQRLRKDRIALICGMAGVGKTALAAELASECLRSSRVLWYSFRHGRNTSLQATLEGLALALAAQGQPDFWRFLQAGQRADPPPPAAQMRFLVNLLERRPHTLCLDDVHAVADVPELDRLLLALRESAGRGKLALILTSRHTLSFDSSLSFAPLDGLTLPEVQQMLQAAGLGWLWDPLVDRLYQRTQGHPLLVNLFITWIHNQGLGPPQRVETSLPGKPVFLGSTASESYERVRRFIDTLERAPDVRHYLLRDVYETLSPVEQHFAHVVSAIRLPFDAAAPGLLAILAEEGLHDVTGILNGLINKHLATRNVGQNAVLSFHALVRDYFYSRFKGRAAECARVNRRLGAYYEHEADDALEAAYHYAQAGDYGRAVDLLAARVDKLHNRGQARLALDQLEAFPLSRLESCQRLKVNVTRGDLCMCIGDFGPALDHFRQALDDVVAAWLPAERADLLRKMGRCCERRGETDQALVYLHAGEQALAEAGDQAGWLEAVRLYGLLGWVYIRLKGDVETGRTYAERALVIVKDRLQGSLGADERAQFHLEQAWIHKCLGVLAARQSKFQEALEHFSRNLEICEALQDTLGIAVAHSNLGGLYVYCGLPARAIEHSRRCLDMVEKMGDVEAVQRVLNNLGEAYVQHGDFDQARECAERCLDLAVQSGNDDNRAAANDTLGWAYHHLGEYSHAEACYRIALDIRRKQIGEIDRIALIHARLGHLYLAWDRVEPAESHLREALRIFGETGTPWMLPEVYRALAEAQLARGEDDAARESATRALELAQAAGHTVYEGAAWRVLGDIAARSDPAQAAACFERCLALLAGADCLFELTLAWRSQGLCLLKYGDKQRGRELLAKVRDVFTALGAQGELARTRRLWHEAQAAVASMPAGERLREDEQTGGQMAPASRA